MRKRNETHLIGRQFARLRVVAFGDIQKGNARWICQCHCGSVRTVSGCHLVSGHTKSCGCLAIEASRKDKKHGLSRYDNNRQRDVRYNMWSSARDRSRRFGVPFEIEPADVIVPERCPVLGIILYRGTGKQTDFSPSLDRITPSLGYVKDNIMVISYRANRLKSNASISELSKVISYMQKHTQHDNSIAAVQ